MYTCPMHPEIQREQQGMCPECGMNLIERKNKKPGHSEHINTGSAADTPDKHEGHSTAMFLKKFWISAVLAIPLVAYSELPELFFGWETPRFPGYEYVMLMLGSVVFFYGGWVFLTGAFRELRARMPGMMTLIALAITAAYTWSIYAVFAGEMPLFWELATLVTIMLLGHWIEMKAVQGAQGALKELSKLLPDTAEVLKNGSPETMPLHRVREGDIVLIRPGARIPVDGFVIEGASFVNEAMVTGESNPVEKKNGSSMIGGTINGEGSLKVKVSKIGEKTFLAGVMRLVQEAQASKSRLQLLSDRAAFYLTIIAVTAGAVTFTWWITTAETGFAVERLVAVLVVACPHALGLAVPLVASISTTKAAQNGFLVRQRLALESARNINTVLFDKTGTLTKGEYGVTNIWPFGKDERQLLQVAASVEQYSEHPTAKALIAKAQEKGIRLFDVHNFTALPGKGVQGIIQDRSVRIGGHAILEGIEFELTEEIRQEAKAGKTIIYAMENTKVIGIFAFADIIREESYDAVHKLKEAGITVAMVTGDAEDVAAHVSAKLGIDEYFSRVLPDKKAGKVKELQQRGVRVAFVGDGINDAPALVQADIGIAIGAGTNVAIESAGIVLAGNDPRSIPKIIRLSKLTYQKMLQNLFWATGYNAAALPLAAGVLIAQGIILQPAAAAVLMSASTVIVAINAMLLRRQTL